MPDLHLVADNDLFFSIDAETRAITYQGEQAPIISQMDHNSEYFTFEVPRYIEGHDMLLCNEIQVHYINLSSNSNITRNTGIYKITDLQLDPDDDTDSTLLCSWLISQSATSLVGSLSFAIRFICTSGNRVSYTWNTGVFSGVTVASTIDNSNIIVEQYTDIIQTWYNDLMVAGTMGVSVVEEAKNKALEAINNAAQEIIDNTVNSELYNKMMADLLATEATVMERERDELIAEILEQLVRAEQPTIVLEEGVSV